MINKVSVFSTSFEIDSKLISFFAVVHPIIISVIELFRCQVTLQKHLSCETFPETLLAAKWCPLVSLTQENVTTRNYHENFKWIVRSFRKATLPTFRDSCSPMFSQCSGVVWESGLLLNMRRELLFQSVLNRSRQTEDALRCSASQKQNSFIKSNRGWMKLNQRCETGRINPKQTARPTSRSRWRSIANCVSEEIRPRVEMWNLCKMEKNGREKLL